jgi:hypothetical protein
LIAWGDITKIERAIKESQARVELDFKHAIERVLQEYRVRLAFISKFVEKKLESYNQLLQLTFDLYRGLAKLTGEQDRNLEHINKQDDYYRFFNENAIYLNREVRRAAEMILAVMTDVMAVSREDGNIVKQIHSVQERSRLISDLLRVEIAHDLNSTDFSVFIPTREQREAWIQESKDIEALRKELEDRSKSTTKLML